jgi:riboflavin biosynthesis pyrimidine reductase
MRALLPDPVDDPDLHDWYARGWLETGGVRVNFVASVDGAVSAAGLSRGLQTPGDNRIFAALRDLADVVLVGTGTALAEGYSRPRPRGARLDRRREHGLADVLPLALVSRSGRGLRPDLPVLVDGDAPPAIVYTTARADLGAIADVAEVFVTGDDAIDYGALRADLAARGLRRILCEGGPTVFAQAAAAGQVDEICLSVSPILAGPGAGRITAGDAWATGARRLELAGLLEEDGALFLRLRAAETMAA